MGNEVKPVGYKSPPVHARFGAEGGNPIGRTSKQRSQEISNAESATRIRAAMLKAVEEKIMDGQLSVEFVEAAMLKMLKDSEDRGLGTPMQSLQLSGEGGGPLQVVIQRYADDNPT